MNDVDVRGLMKREELEELVRPLLERATAPLAQACQEAKVTPDNIDGVELVGGGTRVPILKNIIQKFFNKNLSYTMNQDEAIARGCAFSCAILSPVFRVRDFTVHDVVNYPIEFTWEKSPDIPDEETSLTVFNKGNVMPSTKILTFYRKQPFDLEAKYAKPELMPGSVKPWIGRFSVKGVKADTKGDFMICKLKARLNLHGVLNVEQGYYVEDQEIEEPVPEPKENKEPKEGDKKEAEKKEGDVSADDERQSKRKREPNETPQAMDTDQANGTAEPKPKMRKVKKQVRKGDLPLSSGTASMDESTKQHAAERENAMFMEDKLVADTEDKKNELESFIYELRGKLDDQYADFANDEEKDKIRAKLTDSEVSDRLHINRKARIDMKYRTGSIPTKEKMLLKPSTSRRLKKSALSLVQSSSGTTTRSKKSDKQCSRSKKRQKPPNVRKPKRRRRQRKKPRRLPKAIRMPR